MRTLAILPMKSFTEAKQRLEPELDAAPRRALAQAMFSDVLVALRRARAVDDILVVTLDHGAQQIAGGHGAFVLDDEQTGHNAAAALGVRHAKEAGFARALLVPGDCPTLNPAELEALIARPAVDGPAAVIVPDRHGSGTNALLLTPPDALPPAFGPGSRARHLANARAARIAAEIVDLPSLALDVDTAEDLTTLQATLAVTHGGAAHTRGMLNQLTRSQG